MQCSLRNWNRLLWCYNQSARLLRYRITGEKAGVGCPGRVRSPEVGLLKNPPLEAADRDIMDALGAMDAVGAVVAVGIWMPWGPWTPRGPREKTDPGEKQPDDGP